MLGVGVVAAGVALGGCSSSDLSQLDEEKEPHFVLGKGRVNAMDYQGAIEAFEQSLETNPHSSSAHFELGWLMIEGARPAAAIYHYGQYLKLCPNADDAKVISNALTVANNNWPPTCCGYERASRAKTVGKPVEQNRQLQDEVNKWRAYYASQLAMAKTNAPPPGNATASPRRPNRRKMFRSIGERSASRPACPAMVARPHTHTVVTGETAAGIARKYGVKLSALEAANPT